MKTRYRFGLMLIGMVFSSLFAQNKPTSVTLPVTLDHNRIIIPAIVYLPDGTIKKINAWVDNGTSIMSVTEGLANEIRSKRRASVKKEKLEQLLKIGIGGMRISLATLGDTVEVEKAPTVGSGVDAAINLPATVLHNYDVIVDYPARKLTIATPGTIHFGGKPVKGFFNPKNYLVQLPAKLGGQAFSLALDIGTPVTYLSPKLISQWHKAHPSWPYTTGAIGIANLWGMDDEPGWHLLRAPKMEFGGITFPSPVVVSFPGGGLDYFEKRAGTPTAGIFGAASMLNYRIGLDYVHGMVYLQQVGKPVAINMNVIGLTLRPENDGRYTILGLAGYDGKPPVSGILKGDVLLAVNDKAVTGLTMGRVWTLLHGKPGAVYKLKLARGGKVVVVGGLVCGFLGRERHHVNKAD